MPESYKGKMKIYLVADIEKLAIEGRTQISLSLKNFLEKNRCTFVEDPAIADIIHFHSSGVLNSFKAAAFKKKYSKPVIYSFYSISKTELIRHFTNHLLQRMFLYKRRTSCWLSYSAILPLKIRGIKLKELDRVIVPSRFVQKKLYSNTKVITLGINTERFKPQETPLKGIKQENIRIGFIGHPNIYKGILDFAKASKKFPRLFEAYIYATVMSDKIRRNLLKINPRLIIFGLMDNIADAYHNLDIIVLPYRSYLGGVANPLVLLEAMACGKAVVTTDFEHIREIVQDSAVIIKKRSPRGIIKAAEFLADNHIRIKLGIKARQIIVQNFDQEIMFQRYLALYNELK